MINITHSNWGKLQKTICTWMFLKSLFQQSRFIFVLIISCLSPTYAAAAAAKSLQSCPTSVRPHRRQATRLPRPWDSPGKNTEVGCHFLLQCMHACKVTSVVSDSVRPHRQQPTRLLRPWNSPGKSTGVGCHFLLLWLSLKREISCTIVGNTEL